VTPPGGGDVLRTTVEVDYGQWYLFDPERLRAEMGGLIDDAVSQAELWERRCASTGGVAIVYTLKQYGVSEVEVRSVQGPAALDGADHVAEFSMVVPSGRLALSGWETTVISATLDVPTEPIRIRISWFGLTRSLESEDETAERFEVEVFPGPDGPVETLRWWPTWAPPAAESSRPNGMRWFTGPKAATARESMEWIPLMFWSPYPSLPDGSGSVTSMWRDPQDDSRWADGSGIGSHKVLAELSSDEARALEAQGFPNVRTYAIDGDGRIWTSDVMPVERTPCLNLVAPAHFEMVKGLSGGDGDRVPGIQVIDLPPGWGRIIRRPRATGTPPEEVAAVDDAIDGFYQRWRDDQPAPTS
jgi:hypothetical protein